MIISIVTAYRGFFGFPGFNIHVQSRLHLVALLLAATSACGDGQKNAADDARQTTDGEPDGTFMADDTVESNEAPTAQDPGPIDEFDDLDTLCPDNVVSASYLQGTEVAFSVQTQDRLRRIAGRVAHTERDGLSFLRRVSPTWRL